MFDISPRRILGRLYVFDDLVMEAVASYFDLATHGVVFMTFGYYFVGVKNLSGVAYGWGPTDICKYWSTIDTDTINRYMWINDFVPPFSKPPPVVGDGYVYSSEDIPEHKMETKYPPIYDLPVRRDAIAFLRSYRSLSAHRYPAASCEDDTFMAKIIGDESEGIHKLPIYYVALLLSEPKEIGKRYPLTYETMRRVPRSWMAGKIDHVYFRLHVIQIATAYEAEVWNYFDDESLEDVDCYAYACLVYPMVLNKVRWLPTDVYRFLIDNAEEVNKIRARYHARRITIYDIDVGHMDQQYAIMMKAFAEGRIPKNGTKSPKR